MKKVQIGILSTLLALSLTACTGGSSTGGSSSGTAQANVGAAVGSIFSSSESAGLQKRSIPSQLLALLVRDAHAAISHTACDIAATAPTDVEISNTITAGTYGVTGSKDDSITVAATDGCDQGGSYAAFEVPSHSMTCSDDCSVTMTNSTGVFKETDTTTEIYGNFNISGCGSSTTSNVGCHFTIAHESGGSGATFEAAVCTDSSGNAIEQDDTITCSAK